MSSGQLYWTCTLGQSVRRTYPSLQATTVNQDLHLMRFILATLSEKTLLVSGYFFTVLSMDVTFFVESGKNFYFIVRNVLLVRNFKTSFRCGIKRLLNTV